MRIWNTVILFTFFVFALIACQKEVSEEIGDIPSGGNPGGGNQSGGLLVRLQQGIDPDIYNDTVRNVFYNADKKISKIVDSLNEDSVVCTYNAAGKLASITDDYGDNVFFTYDGAGLLTEVDYTLAGERGQYKYFYNNGIIEKKEHWSDNGSGAPLSLWRYYTYTVSGGNITTMKEYTKAAVLVKESTFTYGSQLNPFKDLGLFNYGNRLGTLYVIDHEAYFNKNLLTGANIGGIPVINTYTFNSSQQVTKIVSSVGSGGTVYTWLLGYK